MIATGPWGWWNANHPQTSVAECITRAKQINGIITKALYWDTLKQFVDAGLNVGIERYSYPTQPTQEANYLAEGIRRGAKFAVVNAEVEWESTDGSAMHQLLGEFRVQCPGVEVYGCTDTRGNRLTLPYHQALAQYITAWLPMIYFQAFGQTVKQAFASALDNKNFSGKPVLPAIQTYGNVGAGMVADQVAEVERRGLLGCSAYTIPHATEPEWATFVATTAPPQEEEEMTFLRWAHWLAHAPGTPKFRSYRIYMADNGPIKIMDVGAAEFRATSAATKKPVPEPETLENLKAIKSTPGTVEPDAP